MRSRLQIVLPAILIACAPFAVMAQAGRSARNMPNLNGVYKPIPNETTLPGGLKNEGSPSQVSLRPGAKKMDPAEDPWKLCKPIGQFRLMARDGNKIELVEVPGLIVMLFEDLSHGVMRQIHLNRDHKEEMDPIWFGDSVGHWEGDTLVVDSIGFNTMTWLNAEGAQHSQALHLVERIRPVLGGKYLEYKMTAEDPMVLTQPYTYTRYYEKLNSEIMEDVCVDEE